MVAPRTGKARLAAVPDDGKTTLPGGHWAKLRDPMDITVTDRDAIDDLRFEIASTALENRPPPGEQAVASPDPTKPGPPAPVVNMEVVKKVRDLQRGIENEVFALFIEEWDFGFPPNANNMRRLPAPVHDALDKLVGPLTKELMPGFGATDDGDPTKP